MSLAINYHDDFNKHIGGGDAYKKGRPMHCTILAVDNAGLKTYLKSSLIRIQKHSIVFLG